MGKGWAYLCHDTICATIACAMAQVYCHKRIISPRTRLQATPLATTRQVAEASDFVITSP